MHTACAAVAPRGDARHDPVAVLHPLRLLHRPEAPFDHDAKCRPPSRRLVEHVAPGVYPFHRAVGGPHERVEPAAVREKHAVAHGQIRLITRVDRERLAPRASAIVAHPATGLLAASVFGLRVVAERRIEPVLVPGEPDPMQKPVAVLLELIWLDDSEPRAGNHGHVDCTRQRHGRIPEHRGVRRKKVAATKNGEDAQDRGWQSSVHHSHLLTVWWPAPFSRRYAGTTAEGTDRFGHFTVTRLRFFPVRRPSPRLRC